MQDLEYCVGFQDNCSMLQCMACVILCFVVFLWRSSRKRRQDLTHLHHSYFLFMGEGGAVFQEHMPEASVNANMEKKYEMDVKIETLTGKKGEEDNGLKGMEVDNECNAELETQKMDVDKEGIDEHKETDKTVEAEKVMKEGKEEIIADKEKRATGQDSENEETQTEEMEEEKRKKTKDPNKEKGSKTRVRTMISDGRKDKGNESDTKDNANKETATAAEIKTRGHKTPGDKKEKELKTPVASPIERPVRERKSVERLVTIILKEKDSVKDFHVEKGRGTALKDIPNVAYKLSRKKSDDTFKLLHTILFNRRGKAAEVKNNISKFSGFVWHDNEEKQLNKVKEKLDKCVKDKLVEFCDVLGIPVSKANTRKEDIIAKLIDFLVVPHATSSELLAENEQPSKGKKRKRQSKSASGNSKSSKGSTKGLKKTEGASKKDGETKRPMPESEDELGGGEEEELKEDANDIPERSGDEMSERAGTEEKETETEDQSDENKGKQKHGSTKPSTNSKKGSAENASTKKKAILKTASLPKKAGGEMSEQAESEEKEMEIEEASDENKGKQKQEELEIEEANDENKGKQKQDPAKSSAKKGSAATTKRKAISKTASPTTKRPAVKSPPSRLKEDTGMKSKSSGKKKGESTTTKETSGKKKDESTPAKGTMGKKKDASTPAKETYGKKKDESTSAKETSKKDESATAKKSSRKKKDESTTEKEHFGEKKDKLTKKSTTPRKPASKESTGAKVMKVNNKLKMEKANPNDDELRHTIVKILKEVDFNTATFTDILKMLAKKYKTDFTPRKSAIKIMIQDELTKLADANEGDDKEDEGDAEKNDKQPSTQDVKA